MRVARHGEEGASHAVTYYAVVDTAARQLAWLSLKPVTGAPTNCAPTWRISAIRSWAIRNISRRRTGSCPGGMQNRLHLLARRIVVPHPRGGVIDITAPLPPHMQQSWNLLGLDAARYDPIVEAPEESRSAPTSTILERDACSREGGASD